MRPILHLRAVMRSYIDYMQHLEFSELAYGVVGAVIVHEDANVRHVLRAEQTRHGDKEDYTLTPKAADQDRQRCERVARGRLGRRSGVIDRPSAD